MLISAELEAIYTNMKVQKMAIPSDITFFFRERIWQLIIPTNGYQ